MTPANPTLTGRLGEVVEANSTSFVAQSYRLYDTPPLGGLVLAGSPECYSVVYRIVTEPLDPSRPVLARGEAMETEEEVFQENPQLNRLLTSRFEALIVGHGETGHIRPFLPPLPPRIHSFVYTCTREQAEQLTSRLEWLRLLLNSGVPAADEVVGACLREAAAYHADARAFLARAATALAAELAGDLPRLNAVLRTISP